MTLLDLAEIAAARELAPGEISAAIGHLLDENRPVPERAAFLSSLGARGIRAGELAGFANALLERAVGLPPVAETTIDVCGTGGDRAGFFNISTAAMFVAAGAGARVAKHGNRGVTSRSGAADALEELGIKIELLPQKACECLAESGCCFFFAPFYHPALKAVAPVRKYLAERGSPSIFNFLGPLLNPARPSFQLAGIFDPAALELYAAAMAELGRTRAWAVNGEGPPGARLDEFSTLGTTLAAEAGKSLPLSRIDTDASSLGFAKPDPASLAGGSAKENARTIEAILAGDDRGPRRDIVALNAAAALRVFGISSDWGEALAAASESIDSGAAARTLRILREVSNR